jgi:aminoglycoside phosphotransferase (APT) family kinase protein
VVGGFDTQIFTFRLAGAKAPLTGPLILRLFAEDDEPTRARWEAAVQTALVAAGYPAPAVVTAHHDREPLGAPFIIMERIPGQPMLQAATFAAALPKAYRLLMTYPSVLADNQAKLHALDAEQFLDAVAETGEPGAAPGEAGISRRRATLDGQLDQLIERVDRLPAADLKPALAWLLENRPSEPARPVICHGDYNPINILMEDGVVTGVVDWAMTTVADAAFDVGITRVNLELAPLDLPGAVDAVVGPLRKLFVRRYTNAYLKLRPVEMETVRYFEALRCLMELSWVGERRLAGAGMYRNPWGAPRSVDKLSSRFRAVAGIQATLQPA